MRRQTERARATRRWRWGTPRAAHSSHFKADLASFHLKLLSSLFHCLALNFLSSFFFLPPAMIMSQLALYNKSETGQHSSSIRNQYVDANAPTWLPGQNTVAVLALSLVGLAAGPITQSFVTQTPLTGFGSQRTEYPLTRSGRPAVRVAQI
jgi:hypothetical protein